MIFTSSIPLREEHLRDDVTLPQFILDGSHPLRSHRGPDRPWLIDNETGRAYNLEEVRERVFGLANALSGLYGIKEDDVVSIFSPNDIDYPIALWAVHRLGATVSCANPSYTASELEYQLRVTKAKFIITHPASLDTALKASSSLSIAVDRIAIILPPAHAHHPSSSHYHARPEEGLATARQKVVTVQSLIERGLGDLNVKGPQFVERKLQKGEAKTKLAFLSFSSGTTGKPKAVAISHYNVTSNVIQTATFIRNNDPTVPWKDRRMRDGDVASCVLPMFHIYGLVMVLHSNLFMGLPLVVLPKYTFTDFLQSTVKHRITHLYVVPPQLVALVKQPETRKCDLSHVRSIMGGAAPISDAVESAVKKLLPNANVGQGYGTTEACATIAMWPISQNFKATPGSAGHLISGWEAKVVKSDAKENGGEGLAGYNEPGELYLRGPCVALGYQNNEVASRETFLEGGWVRTGDQVLFNENGDLFVVDRLKEVFKVRGSQVAPAELEGHLLGHSDVQDACVVGVTDEYSGELPLAFIVLQPKASRRAESSTREFDALKQSIKKHVSDHKVRYKWLDGGVVFIDVIPKNPSGKILRRLLKADAQKHKDEMDAQKVAPKL